MNTIGENVRRMRAARRVSREGLGRLCLPPLSHGTIASVEKGGDVRLTTLRALVIGLSAAALPDGSTESVTLEDLLAEPIEVAS